MGDVKRNVEADLRELVATILEVEPNTIPRRDVSEIHLSGSNRQDS